MSAEPVPSLRRQAKAARRCRLGYEYGYWMVNDKTDERVYVRIGIARTMQSALKRLESL